MCRAARQGGSGSLLWPKGMTSIEEVPIDLIRAIGHAFKILDWYENLTEEERPPEWMWTLDDELEHWFDEVDSKRKDRFGGRSDDEESGPMMQNAEAEQLKKELRGGK